MAPLQPLVHEDLADAAPLDRDALLLVEVGAKAVECPAAEGLAQALRVGQRRGDHLGALLGRVDVRAAGPRTILQSGEALFVEAMDPGVDGGTREAELLGNSARRASVGDGQEDPGPLDGASLGRPGGCELLEDLTFLAGQFTECHSGEGHGCTSLCSKATPFLRRTPSVSSLAGCTT